MDKTTELAPMIAELRTAARSLINVADYLSDLFAGSGAAKPVEPSNTDTAQPEETPLTLEEVRAVLAEKSRSGHTAEVRALLTKYGASKLSEIEPAKYSALLGEAKVLGNE